MVTTPPTYQSPPPPPDPLSALERQAPPLALHRLPGHQQLIAPLEQGFVAPVMERGEAWMRRFGYRALGPWLISWGSTGQPNLRRPVNGALKRVNEEGIRTQELPPLMMLAVPFQGWPILPKDIMPVVQRQGLAPLGQPLLLALGKEPPSVAWVPVAPSGTTLLLREVTAGNFSRKIGYLARSPEPGELLSTWDMLRHAFMNAVNTYLSLAMIGVLIFNCFGFLFLWALFFDPLGSLSVILEIFFYTFGGLLILSLIGHALAAKRWNDFWRERPIPPLLTLHGGSGTAEEMPSWLGGGR